MAKPVCTIWVMGVVAALSFACDSKKSGPAAAPSSDTEPQSVSGLERPDELSRPPTRGLPPELKPPR
jgi:hypothetical protein